MRVRLSWLLSSTRQKSLGGENSHSQFLNHCDYSALPYQSLIAALVVRRQIRDWFAQLLKESTACTKFIKADVWNSVCPSPSIRLDRILLCFFNRPISSQSRARRRYAGRLTPANASASLSG